MHALRLFNRATETLTRLHAPSPHTKDEDDPFALTELKNALNAVTGPAESVKEVASKQSRRLLPIPVADVIEWEIIDGILHTLLTLSLLYFNRGTPREAEYFATEAQRLAESVKVPAMISRALMRKSEVLLYLGRTEDALGNIMKAVEYLERFPGTDSADVVRLKGDYNYAIDQTTDALSLYVNASCIIMELESTFGALDSVLFAW